MSINDVLSTFPSPAGRVSREIETKDHHPPLIVSLCNRQDKSSQWLHYGESGRGVAIGFNRAYLRLDVNASGTLDGGATGTLVDVDYTPESQIAKLKARVARGRLAVQTFKQRAILSEAQIAHTSAAFASAWIEVLVARMKDSAFSDEEEWRIVAGCGFGKHEYRAAAGRIVRYASLPFRERTVCEIVLGYSSPMREKSVEMFAKSQNLVDLRVWRSKVPVRP